MQYASSISTNWADAAEQDEQPVSKRQVNNSKNKSSDERRQTTALPDESSPTALSSGTSTDAAAEEKVESIASFDDMHLKENLLRGIYGYGMEQPSAIQQKAIVPFASGRDIIAIAQSGTGKTLVEIVGVLQQVDEKRGGVQALILAPTRELAQQSARVAEAVGTYLGVGVHACVGGTRVSDDIERLRSGEVHLVVGTPGRVHDMLHRRRLDARDIRTLVLDEADEMLSAGFEEQIRAIFSLLHSDVQVGLFSATMPPEALAITERFMRQPLRILVKKEQLTLEGIQQFYVAVERDEWKLDTICDLYDSISVTQAVIFCNTRRRVEHYAVELEKRGHTVSATSSDLSQQEREAVLNQFRTGSSRVLITTDLLARGIDVHQVSLVVNIDLPRDPETYLHRIGRSGRFGRKGIAINFVTDRDVEQMRRIEQHYDMQVQELPANINDLLS